MDRFETKNCTKIQPVIQFVAAFPANLFYPLFVIAIVKFHLNVEIWVTPLMILGTQWYILFNVIAGASAIPRELYLAADNFGLKGWLWWKRLAPGIFPFILLEPLLPQVVHGMPASWQNL